MTGYCKVNITVHWGYMETLQGEVKAELGWQGLGGRGGNLLQSATGKKGDTVASSEECFLIVAELVWRVLF